VQTNLRDWPGDRGGTVVNVVFGPGQYSIVLQSFCPVFQHTYSQLYIKVVELILRFCFYSRTRRRQHFPQTNVRISNPRRIESRIIVCDKNLCKRNVKMSFCDLIYGRITTQDSRTRRVFGNNL